jgi:Ca2+-binding RTX toxin-like protein
MDCSKLTNDQKKNNPRCDEDKPDGATYTDGPDELRGGPGDDQLVTDYPCGAHFNSGGPGKDIAGFARSGKFDLNAQLAGGASIEKSFHGMAYNPQLCGLGKATKFDDDLEILEAADGNDELWGNDVRNIIWGREGNDHIHGLGGNDTLEGLLGEDSVWGGAGDDEITGAEHQYPDAD